MFITVASKSTTTTILSYTNKQREGYPETRIFRSNVGYVLAWTICFMYLYFIIDACSLKINATTFNIGFSVFFGHAGITYIITKDSGLRVSLPL